MAAVDSGGWHRAIPHSNLLITSVKKIVSKVGFGSFLQQRSLFPDRAVKRIEPTLLCVCELQEKAAHEGIAWLP